MDIGTFFHQHGFLVMACGIAIGLFYLHSRLAYRIRENYMRNHPIEYERMRKRAGIPPEKYRVEEVDASGRRFRDYQRKQTWWKFWE